MVPYPSSSSSSTIRSSSSSSNDNENHPNSESRATERMATLPSALRKFYMRFFLTLFGEKRTRESANERNSEGCSLLGSRRRRGDSIHAHIIIIIIIIIINGTKSKLQRA